MSKIYYVLIYGYTIQYHLVWYVKYQHDIRIGQTNEYVKDLLNLIADDNALYILDMGTHNDYGYLQIQNTEEQIRRYIKIQKKK